MSDLHTDDRKLLALAAVILAFVVAGVLAFLIGESLNFVATGHGTGTPVFDAPTIAARLPFSLRQPAAAWPADSRPSLEPIVFWIFAAAIFLLGSALARVVIRRTDAIDRIRDSRSAEWAKLGELRRLIVSSPLPRRLTFGYANGKLIAGEETRSLAVLGPPGSMKTTAIAVPALLEWKGPAIVTSVKTDLMTETIAHRRAQGKVRVYDPAQVIELHQRHHWTPLSRCSTFDGAQRTAAALVNAAKLSAGGGSDGDFWYSQAADLLGPYLYAANISGKEISTLVQWIDAQNETDVTAALLDDPDDMPLSTAEGIWKLGPDQRSSVFTTARTVVAAYRNAKVLDTARRPEISPEEILDGGNNTLYLCAPTHEQQVLRPLYSTIIQEIIHAAYEHEARTGQPLDPPLLLLLDEAANIAPIEDLDAIASTARGVGIQIVSIFQDLAQIIARYGREKAQTIVSCHLAKIVLPGISDEHTLDFVSRVTGDQEVRQLSHTSGTGSKSTNESTTFRSLAPANVVRELKRGTGLLIYDNMPPVRFGLRQWFEDRVLTRLVEKAKRDDPMRLNPATGEVLVPPEESGVTAPELIGPPPARPVTAVGASTDTSEEESEPEAPVAQKLELPWRSL